MRYHLKLMELIIRSRAMLSANEKLVLIAIANFTDQFGLAYPTLEQIEQCTSLSRSTIIRVINACDKRGLIIRARGRTGRATTYQFTCFNDIRFADELLGVSVTHQEKQRRIDQLSHVISNNLTSWGVSQTLIEVKFEHFWEMYPKHVGKAHAYFAFVEATKNAEIEEILDGLRAFIRDECYGMDEQFIPHPAHWLEGERWLDEY